MSEIYSGNATVDGGQRRGWIVGPFMPDGLVQHQNNIEIKYGNHSSGDARIDWVEGESRTTMCMLISGSFELNFKDRTLALSKPGDYTMWGPGIDHKWRALEESVVLTVRWTQ